jgi:hypothetical protein
MRLAASFARVSVLLAVAAAAAAAPRWEVQYFYDEDRSTLSIHDLKFPSARRGVAAGIVDREGKTRPVAVVTGDGGANWTIVPLKETPVSLFFLNENVGWMVTPKNLWRTDEAGRSWRKVAKAPRGLLRVYFLSELEGWGVGMSKSVYRTTDGGKKWEKVPAAAEPKTNPQSTAYTWIEFATPQVGIIAGYSRNPRRSRSGLPDWMDPEAAASRREWPHISITLDTRNGGNTWTPSTGSMFGNITRVQMLPDGTGLALLEFVDSFAWPAEVYRLEWKTGKSTRVFREKNRAITDIALLKSGTAYLAGYEVAGSVVRVPVPGKLKILKTDDLNTWHEMEVDYRATALRATLAAADERNVWVATDTGMILKLVP